jgi:hypothetical protein
VYFQELGNACQFRLLISGSWVRIPPGSPTPEGISRSYAADIIHDQQDVKLMSAARP